MEKGKGRFMSHEDTCVKIICFDLLAGMRDDLGYLWAGEEFWELKDYQGITLHSEGSRCADNGYNYGWD